MRDSLASIHPNLSPLTYREIFNCTADAIFIQDARTTAILDCNDSAVKLYGYANREEVLAARFEDFCSGQDPFTKENALEKIRQALQGPLPTFEWQGRRKDGTVFWVEVSLRPWITDDVAWIIATVSDIDTRKKATALLAESEAKYRGLCRLMRLLCDNATDLIWAKDLDKNYLFANRAICQKLLLARDPEEPLGKNDLFFALRERSQHPDDPRWHTFGELCRDSDHIVMQVQKPCQFEEFGFVQGRFLFLDVQKAPLWDESGQMIGTVGCARDVTEQRKFEKQLILREQLSRLLAEESLHLLAAPMQQFDEAVNRLLASIGQLCQVDRSYLFQLDEAAEKLCNTHEWCAEGISSHLDELQDLRRQDAPQWWKVCFDQREVINIADVTQMSPDWSKERAILLHQRIQSLLAIPLYSNEKALGFVGFDAVRKLREWTGTEIEVLIIMGGMLAATIQRNRADQAREKLIADLRLAKENAETASRVREEFLAVMSHEMRTPLNPILGFARVLQQKSASEEDRHLLDLIIQAGERLLTLVENILDFAKLDKGKHQPHRQVFLPVETCILALANVEHIAHGLELRFENGGPNGLPVPDDLRVMGEKDMLQRILDNFLVNACKYTKTGTIRLLLWMEASTDQLTYFHFAVQDTGIGIAPEIAQKLFQPFFQVDSSFTRSFQGVGLGLAICRKIADLLGGTIHLQSEPGKGSRFTFTVPLEIVLEPSPTSLSAKRPLILPRPCHVLIVDDSQENLILTQKFLQNFGATHCSACHGLEALELCRKVHFDVILMDLAMPIMDGLEAARRIRAESVFPEVPIIALTADVTEKARQLCREHGMEGFVSKPVRQEELFRVIAHHLRAKSRNEQHTATRLSSQ